MTPQGLEQCFKLTDQFRRLPDTHSNHEDKLQVCFFIVSLEVRFIFLFFQIKNILYHTIKECVEVLKQNVKCDKMLQ